MTDTATTPTLADLGAVHRVAEHYKLAIPRAPISGALGEMMGSTSGSSLEFHDYRQYVPGDDPRHIDWAALARSDQLMVRLYREEVAPFADVLLDGSLSMAVGGGAKARLARELALAFDLFAGQAGARPAVWLVGEQARPLDGATETKLAQIRFDASRSFEAADAWRGAALRRRSIRVVISDFLFIHEADLLVKQLAQAASALWLVQVLDPDEARPLIGGGVRFVDAESREHHDIVLNDKNVGDYLKRLGNLQAALARACRRAGGRFLTIVADRPLDAICRSDLLPAGAIVAE